jgi:hypothetical protein
VQAAGDVGQDAHHDELRHADAETAEGQGEETFLDHYWSFRKARGWPAAARGKTENYSGFGSPSPLSSRDVRYACE